jgi:hypothetical protein
MNSRKNLLSHSDFFIYLTLILSLGFLIRNAHIHLTTDDIGWLHGQTPTVFDQYRLIPRVFFMVLHALFGPNQLIFLGFIFIFHALNTLLIYNLCLQLHRDVLAARTAAVIMSINPLTLTTLTWYSCFSYILGTTFALLSILALCRSSRTTIPKYWLMIAFICYVAGLCCSHEIFFLPVIFLIFSWLESSISFKRGIILFMLSTVAAIMVYWFLYHFNRYGIESVGLLNFKFVSAYLSSIVSFFFTISLAYPLSFFVKPMAFMQNCFGETYRWLITIILTITGIMTYKQNKQWKLCLALFLCFVSAITPYIIRLYLIPPEINYDVSYILTGRILYFPFIVIAVCFGYLFSLLVKQLKPRLTCIIYMVLCAAYANALLFLYRSADFVGLEVLHGLPPKNMPPRWEPYIMEHPIWLAIMILLNVIFIIIRLVIQDRNDKIKF